MRINVAQQLKSSVGDVRRYAVSETTEEGFAIQGEAKLVLTNRSILVTGRFGTTIRIICSRCLAEVDQPLQFEIEEEFFPSGDILSGAPETVDEETRADGFTIGEDHILDMDEAIRQNMLLSNPFKPVCRPDCAGLCPKCGHNLNFGPCGCPDAEIDPRWSPLRRLLDQTVERGSEVN